MHHTVGDVMTRDLIVVSVLDTLEEARALMEDHGVHRLPVLDEEGQLQGILSWGDVREATSVEAATTNPFAPQTEEDWLTVWEAMSRDPIVVTPETVLVDAVELMLNHKIGGLPVGASLSGPGRRQLVGIVTDTDIFRLVLRLWRAEDE